MKRKRKRKRKSLIVSLFSGDGIFLTVSRCAACPHDRGVKPWEGMMDLTEVKEWLKEPAPDNGEDDGLSEARTFLWKLLAEVERLNQALSDTTAAWNIERKMAEKFESERDKYKSALDAQLTLVNGPIITTWPDIAGRLIAIAKEATAEAVRS